MKDERILIDGLPVYLPYILVSYFILDVTRKWSVDIDTVNNFLSRIFRFCNERVGL